MSVYMVLALASLPPALAAQPPANDNDQAGWWEELSEGIRSSEYDVSEVKRAGPPRDKGSYQAPNRANDLRTHFEASGVSVSPRTDNQGAWSLQLSAADLHRGNLRTASAFELIEPIAKGRSIEYERGDFTEWYVNLERGLEQGFRIGPPSPGSPRVTEQVFIDYQLLGDLDAVVTNGEQAVDFLDRSRNRVLRLVALSTTDAFGKSLPSRLSVNPSEGSGRPTSLHISIDTATADYPIMSQYLLSRPSLPQRSVKVRGAQAATLGAGSKLLESLSVSAAMVESGTSSDSNGAAWVLDGEQDNAELGYAVSRAGDVNGDGYGDVLVAAWLFDAGEVDEGKVYGFYGSATGFSLTPDWTAEGNQAGARLGHSVATAGDVNGDGYDDVILGADFYGNGQAEEGRALLYLGSVAGLGSTAAWTAESDQPGAHFGVSVSTAGDVNGDGYDDVLVGAYGYDGGQTDEGRVYLYYGSATGLGRTAAWTAESDQAFARLGHSVATAGDVNGDGYDDVIVGSDSYGNGQPEEGRAFLYLGSAAGLGSTAAWMAESNQSYAYFGLQVSPAGDVNGDGYDDVIIGAPNYDNGEVDEGGAFVYHGSPAGLDPVPAWISQGNQTGALYGWAVGTAGDVNGDGFDDVVVGAPLWDASAIDEGAAFVYHGSPGGLSLTPDWNIQGDQDFAQMGATVRLGTAGDVNGDGYGDLLIGARLHDNGKVNEGRVELFLGSAMGLPLPPPAPSVAVLRPNASGEKLFTGTPFVIEWAASENGQPLTGFDVVVSTDGGLTYNPIIECTALAGTARSCTWNAPGPVTSQGRIRVTAHDSGGHSASDISDANFSIVAGTASITVTQPNTGLSWTIGVTQPIKWNHNLGANSWVRIELSRDNGAIWEVLSASFKSTASGSGTFSWLVTAPITTTARVRVTWLNGPVSDQSDVPFAIAAPAVTVTQPNTNLNWVTGSTQSIKWSHNIGVEAFVKIELSRTNGATWETLSASFKNTSSTSGTFGWVVTGPATTQALVRITQTTDAAVTDTSNTPFTIADPFIIVSLPKTGATSWGYNSVRRVTWATNLTAAFLVQVRLSTDGGATFPYILATNIAASTKAAAITTPTLGTLTTEARLRVEVISNPAVQGTNPVNFRVEPAFVQVLSPNGPSNPWTVGTTKSITWNQNLGSAESVSVELSRDGGATYTVMLLASTPSDGTENVTVQASWITQQGRVRIRWLKDGTVADVSDNNFPIQ